MATDITRAFTAPPAGPEPSRWLEWSHVSWFSLPPFQKAVAILQNIKSLLQMRHRRRRGTNIHEACGHGKCVLGLFFFFFFESGCNFLISFEQHLALLLNYE